VPDIEERTSNVQFRPLEEQLYRAMAIMINQPQAHCLVKIPSNKRYERVRAVKVPRVEEGFAVYCPDMDLLKIYEEENFKKYKNQFIALKEDVDREIEQRQDGLMKTAQLVANKKDKERKGGKGSEELWEDE